MGQIKGQVEEVCKVYTNLTSLLIHYGYEYILDHLELVDDISCIAETLNILETLEYDDLAARQAQSNKDLPRLVTAQAEIFKPSVPPRPMVTQQRNPPNYQEIAGKLDDRMSEIFDSPSDDNLDQLYNYRQQKKQQREIPKMKAIRSLREDLNSSNQRITRMKKDIRTKLNSKIQEKTTQQGPANRINLSVNVEDLNLQI